MRWRRLFVLLLLILVVWPDEAEARRRKRGGGGGKRRRGRAAKVYRELPLVRPDPSTAIRDGDEQSTD